MCDFINSWEGLIHITTLGEYREVAAKVMRVIKEWNAEKKRRKASWKQHNDDVKLKTQTAKAGVTTVLGEDA